MTFKSNNAHTSNDLFSFIGSISNYTTMNNFDNNYSSIISEFFDKPESRLSSEIDVSNLDSFKLWSTDAIKHKHIVYPLLIVKILQGDIFALNIYDNLHKIAGNNQVIVDYSKIHSNPLLMSKFNEYGGAEDSRAILTAEYWLKSKESAEIMEQNEHGIENLCSLTGSLHITNDYINCT